jgi:hypothetical protein
MPYHVALLGFRVSATCPAAASKPLNNSLKIPRPMPPVEHKIVEFLIPGFSGRGLVFAAGM